MRKCQPGSSYFFVDESGDTTFYSTRGKLIVGLEGCSPMLILGFIETQTPHTLRDALLALQTKIVNDPRLQRIPSVQTRTARFFHATDDIPEIRQQVFTLLRSLDFSAQVYVARKSEESLQLMFQANGNLVYDHLVSRLFQNVLHRYEHNYIYYARRDKERIIPFRQAIHNAKGAFEAQFGMGITSNLYIQPQVPSAEPCLSVVDYIEWAVQRAYRRGEMQYYEMIRDKVSLHVDLYDNKWYSRKHPFDITKATPL